MLSKIQKYLLLHFPLVWNVRLVPVLLITIAINALLFILGYISNGVDFSSSQNYYSGNYFSSGLLYFGTIVLSLLFLIFWLISYSKNNAFKVFYPKNAKSLYVEWILILICLLGMSQFPLSFNRGETAKIRTYVSKEDMEDAIKTLNMVKILIPENKTYYYKEYPDEYIDMGKDPIEKTDYASDYAVSNLDSGLAETVAVEAYDIDIDDKISVAESKSMEFSDYPNFRQLSLMNYTYNRYIYIPYSYKLPVGGCDQVKKWLAEENKVKIEELMDSFLDLQKKHGLESNLTREVWMKLIYNPKQYPVGDFNLINPSNIYKDVDGSYQESVSQSGYYLNYLELASAYSTIMNAYMDKGLKDVITLVSVCISIAISLLVFSYRITSGKSWLMALVSIGLILIIDLFVVLLSDIFDNRGGFESYLVLLLIVFICEFVYLCFLKSKDRSNLIMNHLIWFIPAVPAFIQIILYSGLENACDSIGGNNCLYHLMRDHILEIVWANVFLTFITVPLFIRFFVLKWKALPEE